jgi:restriction system protein
MAKESLFSILSRSPWWLSVMIAAVLFALVRRFLSDIAALFAALPFVAIAGYALWRQLRVPSVTNVAEMLGRLRAMSWEDFSAVIGEAFRRDGYTVTEIPGSAADLELRKNGRVSIACCKRWKVANTGVGPLRALHEAMQARDADECIYVAAGDFTANARAFATEKAIRLLNGAALVKLVARVERGRWRWSFFR